VSLLIPLALGCVVGGFGAGLALAAAVIEAFPRREGVVMLVGSLVLLAALVWMFG
jgi:hypothetical protein|tara:strand:- start:16 stop:180 length:165 start_codon:yes stop_codon:yes gene_type:complete